MWRAGAEAYLLEASGHHIMPGLTYGDDSTSRVRDWSHGRGKGAGVAEVASALWYECEYGRSVWRDELRENSATRQSSRCAIRRLFIRKGSPEWPLVGFRTASQRTKVARGKKNDR